MSAAKAILVGLGAAVTAMAVTGVTIYTIETLETRRNEKKFNNKLNKMVEQILGDKDTVAAFEKNLAEALKNYHEQMDKLDPKIIVEFAQAPAPAATPDSDIKA